MQEKLTVSALQFNIKLGIVEKNVEQAVSGLKYVSDQGARLAVLPEMWSAGYDYRRLTEHAAETPRILDRLCQLSDELNMVIVGSLPEQVGDDIYNTATV
ncbi:MAG: carbon-nitrogen family hydrolase, partial [Desulfuromonadales bacterium]|nr:carbon-nitrogen family hydrolase [Desulfuromonadales bacterium]NIS43815.1 carbon-nitrogen family hydrolase [Desulfuromonadales bacterium]